MTTVKDEKQRIDYLLSRDNVTDQELEKIYLEAVNLLRSIISEEFNSYAVDGVLTPQYLTHRVTKKDMVLLKKLYDQLPDNLELSEQQRVDYYLASSQTSLSRLLIASIGIALVGVTHKVAKIIRKNNKRAVREEYSYRRRSLRAPRRGKVNQIGKDNYELPKMAVPWLDRLWLDHDQMLNRIDNQITSMLKQGMRAQDIAEKLFPGNAESMRKDNIPKTLINASVSAKRLARTEAAAREDEVSELFLIKNKTKYFDWVTERGACRRCTAIALAGPYKVGDINSPRIPIDSHPNCRCRRIPAEVETDETADRSKKALAAGIVSGIGKRDGKKENTEKVSEETNADVLMENFNKGIWKDSVNIQKQARHLSKDGEGTPQDGKSKTIFNGNVSKKEIDEWYYKYKGTGEFEFTRRGERKPTEVVNLSKVVAIDNKGRRLTGIKIHYSKTGTHLVPWKGDSNDFK